MTADRVQPDSVATQVSPQPSAGLSPHSAVEVDALIAEGERRLAELQAQRTALLNEIDTLRRKRAPFATGDGASSPAAAGITSKSSTEEKLALFRRLFRGRDDVYARRWDDRKTGRSGYAPACRYEPGHAPWERHERGHHATEGRVFLPLTDYVVRSHLRGEDPAEKFAGSATRDFTIGIYPLLTDETCWLLAVDFDKATWQEDVGAFLDTCHTNNVPAALERSRSGNGGHIWFFFEEPIPAALARQLGTFLLTATMERRPELGMESYDRLFPNQDTMPAGGLGNLIALPLQRKPREQGNSVFLDEKFTPYPDQIALLASLRPISRAAVIATVDEARRTDRVLGVRTAGLEEDDDSPWAVPPSRQRKYPPIADPLPAQVTLVQGNQLYVSREGLPPALINRLVRIAAFQNPEFYKAQGMRLSTFGKPRIIGCAEEFVHHYGLPRGCLDEVLDLFHSLDVKTILVDERVMGSPLKVRFLGTLQPSQEEAARRLLVHDIGVLAATTAFGKTVVAARLIAEREVSTLVLVHRRELLDQWVERLTQFLDIDRKQIGQIGGGKRRITGMLDVALVQSLCRKGVVDDLVQQYGHLVIDECHHISAVSFERIARACKARFVVGLSATTIRKDGHHPIIFMQCGPVRYRTDARRQADLRPFDHRVVVRPTVFKMAEPFPVDPTTAIHDIYKSLLEDDERNKLIVKDVLAAVALGRSPVLLTERIRHVQILADSLRSLVRHVIVLTGSMGAKQRRSARAELSEIPDDEERILLSTGRYLGEGFDDARLDALFLVMPISWRGTLAQYAGRLHRVHSQKKDVIIYDYADLNVPVLARMHERRLRGYKALGYRFDTDSGSQDAISPRLPLA